MSTALSPLAFCYWLMGHFELEDPDKGLSPKQVVIIKDHLKLVFNKETPNREDLDLSENKAIHFNYPKDYICQFSEPDEDGYRYLYFPSDVPVSC